MIVSLINENQKWPEDTKYGGKITRGQIMIADMFPDEKYLFNNNNGDISWVNAGICDQLGLKINSGLERYFTHPNRIQSHASSDKPLQNTCWIATDRIEPDDSGFAICAVALFISLRYDILISELSAQELTPADRNNHAINPPVPICPVDKAL